MQIETGLEETLAYSRNLAAAGNLLDSIAKSGFDEDVICGLGRIEEVALANGE